MQTLVFILLLSGNALLVGCANIPRRALVPEPAQASTSANDAGVYELEKRWHL